MKKVVIRTAGNGIIKVGTLYGPIRKNGLVRYDFTNSAARSRNIHVLYVQSIRLSSYKGLHDRVFTPRTLIARVSSKKNALQ